jgi:hypothetical protein
MLFVARSLGYLGLLSEMAYGCWMRLSASRECFYLWLLSRFIRGSWHHFVALSSGCLWFLMLFVAPSLGYMALLDGMVYGLVDEDFWRSWLLLFVVPISGYSRLLAYAVAFTLGYVRLLAECGRLWLLVILFVAPNSYCLRCRDYLLPMTRVNCGSSVWFLTGY